MLASHPGLTRCNPCASAPGLRGCWRLALLWSLIIGPWFLLQPGCTSTPSAPETPAQDAAAVNALIDSCLLCHSTREMQRGPILDGLPAWYVELQLRRFMTGERGQNPDNKSEHLMGSGISLLKTDDDLATVVRHFSQLPPAKHLKTIRGDNERGAQHFTSCATCHGPNGRGREEIKAPPLIVQEDWYLFDQLNRIKAGLRGGQDTNGTVWLMHQAVQGLNTQDFRDVVSYINDELAGRGPDTSNSAQ